METLGSTLMMDWRSFDATEGSEVMEQLLGPYPSTEDPEHGPILGSIPSMFDLVPYYRPHVCYGTSTMGFFSPTEYEVCYVDDSNMIAQMDLCSNESSPILDVSNPQIEDPVYLNGEMSDPRDHGNSNVPTSLLDQNSFTKRKLDVSNLDHSIPIENPKKKCRVSVKKNARKKKAQSAEVGGEEENNASLAGQSYSSSKSEEDLNAYQEMNGYDGMRSSTKNTDDLNVSRKTRSHRGTAVDPPSLYARKRREKIDERLRILQNLVPNGRKVDISTMLEEAVDYVKFLQLQIKLLISNDLWMYAPIAYNGMDFGIGATISLPK